MPADSHCHLNDPAFVNDLDEAVKRAHEAGVVYILNVGYDLATTERAIELAEQYEGMYASAGLHPHNASDMDDKLYKKLKDMARHPRVIAIGETGLDFYRDRSPRDDQRNSLRRQITLARDTKKPLIVHCRDAMEECLEILDDEHVEETRGVMHCFAGTPEDVKKIIEMNMYVSFAGNVTYPKAGALRESLKAVPGHRLLIETDSPYLSPRKKRGNRNEPSFLPAVVETAAETRGVTENDINRISVTNFKTLFCVGEHGKGQIVYLIRNSLYVNVTRECTNECGFCARFFSDSVQGHNLRITEDPSVEEMVEAIGDPTCYDEVVFCGFGEPSMRLDRVVEVGKTVKAMGGVTRMNTNGHGSGINGRNIAPDLKGVIDHLSVSLNAQNAEVYDDICQPQIKNGFITMLEFIRAAKHEGIEVTATVVDIPGKVDVEACRRIAEDELGVNFRIRAHHIVG